MGASAVAGSAGCGEEAGDPNAEKINFGYIGDWNGTSLLAVAQKQGLWAKHGLDASIKVFTNGPLQVQALQTGDLDYGYIGPGAFWLPASGQAKIIAINTIGAADRVIAQPGITSVAGLRGRKVGVPEGTSGDMILTLALQKAGLTNADVERVPLDASTLVSAFASKQIDAAGFWYPAIATIKKTIPDLVELAKNDDFTDTVAFPNAFVAGNAVPAARTAKVVAVLREANDYRATHRDAAIAATAELLKLKVEDVTADAANSRTLTTAELDAATKDGTIAKWLTGMGDYFVGAGKLPQQADPASYYLGDVYTGAA
ncbi:aliphatic sulfonate ABC transporter substrate-binding protein [Catenuloplanes japonicus]|uniref:aliphatic sulfonate ABC transporter substrate-binding protein n=1 Tax=Catenuloplanes japonicus TaxID=33876 RepID=UPI0018DCB421|nr:aliphatic sulfonate ABC transporter substrate-binding protein [Catenuloplanes japonicus]